MYVAVAKKDDILTSPDGFNWTPRYSSGSDYIERIIWANGRFVAVGEKCLIMTSTNGLNWTRLSDVTPADLEGIAYGNGLFVAVGGYFDSIGAIPIVLTSPDGLNWTDQPDVYFFGVRARGVTFATADSSLSGTMGSPLSPPTAPPGPTALSCMRTFAP